MSSTHAPLVGEHTLYCTGPDSFESPSGMSSWRVLTTIAGRSDFQALPSFPSVWSLLLAHGKLEWLLTTATHGSFRKRRSVHHIVGCYRSLYLFLRSGFSFLTSCPTVSSWMPPRPRITRSGVFSEHQSHQSRHAGHVFDTSQVHIGRLSREQLVHVVGLCYSHRTTRANSLRFRLRSGGEGVPRKSSATRLSSRIEFCLMGPLWLRFFRCI